MKVRNCFLVIGLFFLSCIQSKQNEKAKVVKDADINVLSKFSLNYNNDLKCDSNKLIFYTSEHFDTSFVLNIVKKDSFFYGICYYVPLSKHRSIMNDNPYNSILFNGFNFVLNVEEWINLKSEFKKLNLSIKDKVCLDCGFMYVSTDGQIKSGYLEEGNSFYLFIIDKVIYPRLAAINH